MNRLADAPSPYLRQHKDNPVDWWPWSDEAFAEAARRDVPVFLSIGYATCHWCHVMAHESFEDPDVAAALNEAFVCVKVDREVRPDVDALYMGVCTAVLGHGGWPLTVLLTPDRRPFYVATYLPPRSRPGRAGVVELAEAITAAWTTRRDEVERAADDLTGLAQRLFAPAPAGADEALGPHTLDAADDALRRGFDPEHGGFGRAPKFPTPHVLTYLLRRYRRTGQADLLAMVEQTLEGMMLGGLHDHVGGGFHRYSTDRVWKLPHFEKMLYDQAGLLMAFAEAAALTGRKDFAETAWAIHRYTFRDLRRDDGLYFAAEDADSARPDGTMHEGAFYVWTPDELSQVLGEADGARVARLFNVVEGGNFEDEATRRRTGESILHLTAPLRDLAPAGEDPDAFAYRILDRLERLREHRESRHRPLRDEKILTDWNAFFVSALLRAARTPWEAFENTHGEFVDTRFWEAKDAELLFPIRDWEPTSLMGMHAEASLKAILDAMVQDREGWVISMRRKDEPAALQIWQRGDGADPEVRDALARSDRRRLDSLTDWTLDGGRLLHALLGRKVGAGATAADYAFLAESCLRGSLRAPQLLRTAQALLDRLIEDHWSEEQGLFTIAARGAADLIAAPAEREDGAMPSANAVAVRVLGRLHGLTGDDRYGSIVARMWEAAAPAIAAHPAGYAAWLVALDERLNGTREVVILAAASPPTETSGLLRREAMARLGPDDLLLLLTPQDQARLAPFFPPLRAFTAPEEGALAYVCHDFRCEAPVADADALRALLGGAS
jgi:uncharacterized protein YyaL (SSP411 family)